MFLKCKKFLKIENGSVTTDWVVLVASLILLSVVVVASITGGALGVSENVASNLSSMDAG